MSLGRSHGQPLRMPSPSHLHQGPPFSALISALVELEITSQAILCFCVTPKILQSYFSSVSSPETLPMMWADSVTDSPGLMLPFSKHSNSEFPQCKCF